GHESAKDFELAKRYRDDRPSTSDPLLRELAMQSTGVARHLETADQLTKNGKMEEAAQLNEKMLADDPGNITFLLNLLYLARFLNRLDGRVDGFYANAK